MKRIEIKEKNNSRPIMDRIKWGRRSFIQHVHKKGKDVCVWGGEGSHGKGYSKSALIYLGQGQFVAKMCT